MRGRFLPGMLFMGALLALLRAGPVYSQSNQGTPTTTGEPSTTPAAPTDETSATPTETLSPTATPFLTDEPSATPTPTPDDTQLPVITETALPTAATTFTPVQLLAGSARYQNRLPDQAGIIVMVLSAERVVLATTTTSADGRFEIVTPGGADYWLVIDAPLHQLAMVSMGPDSMLPEMVTLSGGDLDDDGCINTIDLALLTAHYASEGSEINDINGDKQTDVSDLAILSGNYNPECIPTAGLIPAPTPILTPDTTSTPTSASNTAFPATTEP